MYSEIINKYGLELVERQLKLERQFKSLGELQVAEHLKKKEVTAESANSNLGQRFLAMEFKSVSQGLHTFLGGVTKRKRGVMPTYTPIVKEWLEIYKEGQTELVEMIGLVCLSCMFSSVIKDKGGVLFSTLSHIIMQEIIAEVQLKAYQNTGAFLSKFVADGLKRRNAAAYKREYAKSCMKRDGFELKKYPKDNLIQLVASFVQVVIKCSGLFEDTTLEKSLEVVPTQALLDGWKRNTQHQISRAFSTCPTLLPPKPWTGVDDGGYFGELSDRHSLLRIFKLQDTYSKRYRQNLKELDLTRVLNVINNIQSTAWKINTDVLDVIQHFIKKGGGVAGIPKLDIQVKPAVLPESPSDNDIKIYKKKMTAFYKNETRRKSIVLRTLSTISTAEDFKNEKALYFPCNMDFRGRIYPIPSFNFQGDDLMKSLLLFAAPRPIYDHESSLKWLYVLGANLAGVDKVSFDARMEWTKVHHEVLIRCAGDPKNELFWSEQDEPCQFLAYCFEYKKAMDYLAKNGSLVGFVTGLPMAFDGTCSGLQHFSAILRDPIGGAAVNLKPADKPSDIYQLVADKVNIVLQKDFNKGSDNEELAPKEGRKGNYLKYGTKALAEVWLTYGVTRKVAKRSVMTFAYGSKEYGFKEQLLEDIIKPDIAHNQELSIFYDTKIQAAAYLAKLLWKAVKTTVTKAAEGMKWLQDCARKVVKDKKVVYWVTPMGLPVQQYYMQAVYSQVQVRCAGKVLRLYNREFTGNIDKRKQVSGIAPNFIHSMDACHLQMTVEACAAKGLKDFAMIHDSFGTSLADAQVMFDTVRETFVNLYTKHSVLDELVDDLSKYLSEGDTMPEQPKKGSLDLSEVPESLYIFS